MTDKKKDQDQDNADLKQGPSGAAEEKAVEGVAHEESDMEELEAINAQLVAAIEAKDEELEKKQEENDALKTEVQEYLNLIDIQKDEVIKLRETLADIQAGKLNLKKGTPKSKPGSIIEHGG